MLAGLWSAMLGCYFEACWLRARLNLRGSRGPHLVSHTVLPEASLLAAANVQLSIPGHPAAAVRGAARRPKTSRPATCAVQVSMASFVALWMVFYVCFIKWAQA